MAIYHLDVSHVSKAKGGSASAKNAYIERAGKYAKDAQEIVSIGHAFMPDFCKDNPRDFWRAADEHERKNAQVCSEIRVALPKELNQNLQVKLVQTFINECLNNQPCTWAIHRGADNNPHAHIMYSARTNEPRNQHDRNVFFKRNGAKKNRDFIEKDWLIETRKSWAIQSNQHLKRAGSFERIDHRTLDVQCRSKMKAVETGLSQSQPKVKVIQHYLDQAEQLDRQPQSKQYRKRPKRRFWHRKTQEPQITSLARKKANKIRPLSAQIKDLKARVSVVLRNIELIDSLTRALTRQRDQKAQVKEANDKALERGLERRKLREATEQINLSSPAFNSPKINKERGFGIGD